MTERSSLPATAAQWVKVLTQSFQYIESLFATACICQTKLSVLAREFGIFIA
jgi:hypothetical protein